MSKTFDEDKRENIRRLGTDPSLGTLSMKWLEAVSRHKYSYNFTWMGRPIIQFPQDIIAMQELIWRVKPDLIIETGIAHGGSLVFYASMLELLGNNGQVLGIDIDIRPHNRLEIEAHPMFKRIRMLQGSSIDTDIIRRVHELAREKQRVLVALDSKHTHEHVLNELKHYAPFVTKGSYLVVFDTIVDHMPEEFFEDRPWGSGDNPNTAVSAFLRTDQRFVIDEEIENKLLITVAPGGYLKCVKD